MVWISSVGFIASSFFRLLELFVVSTFVCVQNLILKSITEIAILKLIYEFGKRRLFHAFKCIFAK